jgi:uncharacterized protein with PIN domain
MIATDTSALMAVVLGEPDANRCIDVLHAADEIIISAGTIAEALIVSGRRGVQDEMEALIEGLPVQNRECDGSFGPPNGASLFTLGPRRASSGNQSRRLLRP